MEGDSCSYRLYRMTYWETRLKIHADQDRKGQYLSTSGSTGAQMHLILFCRYHPNIEAVLMC